MSLGNRSNIYFFISKCVHGWFYLVTNANSLVELNGPFVDPCKLGVGNMEDLMGTFY